MRTFRHPRATLVSRSRGRGGEDRATRTAAAELGRRGTRVDAPRGPAACAADHAQADDDRAYGIIDSGVDGADGAGDEEDDVVPVVVVVETGNPHRVRRTGMGNGRQREQDAQEQDSERCTTTHSPRPYVATPASAMVSGPGLPTFALTRRPRALRFTGDHRKPRRIQCRSS